MTTFDRDAQSLSSGSAFAARPDAAAVITLYILLLTLLPSRLIVGPLGAAGTPAQVLGMVALLWWCANWLTGQTSTSSGRAPVRVALLIFSTVTLASYLVATARPIDAVEIRAADRGLLTLCAWLGVFLLVSDRVGPRERLNAVLRGLVLAVSVIGVVGIIQFATGESWVNRISVPGLTLNSTLAGIEGRVGFARPAGTAIHPIEFGVVLAMVLPLALHFAFNGHDQSRLRRWTPPSVISLALVLSISRSAVLAALVVVLVLLPTWSATRRRQAYGLILLLGAAVYVVVPGLLGATQGLFLGIQDDDSARSRTDSYALVAEFVARAPLLGRGVGTFLPAYRILDNQYLVTSIEVGLLGLASLLALLVAGGLTARQVRRRTTDRQTRDLAQSLAAGVAAGALSLATFDGLAFPMMAGLLFLLLGAIAALHRLEAAPPGAYRADSG